MEHLYEKLVNYSGADYYPMHMPGHKRNAAMMSMVNPYLIDITEIDGFDNLHDAEGILFDCMERAATLYHSKHTHYLVNGSTVGLLVAIAACTNRRDKILVARNCHKAVYHGIFLNELHPIYLYPEMEAEVGILSGVTVSQVKEQLDRNPDIQAVVVTSPTYEGIVSDIEGIANLVHDYGIPLIVDEAHGAHFGFHEGFPSSSVVRGADIVIHSVHKTLPAFTQTALIHINGDIVDYRKVQMYLSIYQSSSPSYLLMAGIDRCITLLEKDSKELFDAFYCRLQEFYDRLSHLRALKLFLPNTKRCTARKLTDKKNREVDKEGINRMNRGVLDNDLFDFDISKIVISTRGTNMTAMQLYELLRNKYRIQLEMVSKDYVLAMTSICDTDEGFGRLRNALEEIDGTLIEKDIEKDIEKGIEKEKDKEKEIEIEKEIEKDIGNEVDKEIHKGIDNKTNIATSESVAYESRSMAPMKMSLVLTPYQAYNLEVEQVSLQESIGRLAGDYGYLYPPGIPLVVPGERISEDFVESIIEYKESGLNVKGFVENEMIRVLLGEHLDG